MITGTWAEVKQVGSRNGNEAAAGWLLPHELLTYQRDQI